MPLLFFNLNKKGEKMLKVLKNLKKSFLEVTVIVILLCIQATTDLALPDYTSKIVNIGIQAGGIETAVPDIIAKEDMDNLLIFTDQNNEILNHYELIGNTLTKQKEKIIDKYLGKDAKIEENTVYILSELEKEEKEELAKLMVNPLMEMTTLQNEEVANQIKEQMTANMPEAQKQLIQSQDLMELIKNMPEEQKRSILEEFTNRINEMQDSIKEQVAISSVKEL